MLRKIITTQTSFIGCKRVIKAHLEVIRTKKCLKHSNNTETIFNKYVSKIYDFLKQSLNLNFSIFIF